MRSTRETVKSKSATFNRRGGLGLASRDSERRGLSPLLPRARPIDLPALCSFHGVPSAIVRPLSGLYMKAPGQVSNTLAGELKIHRENSCARKLFYCRRAWELRRALCRDLEKW